MLKQVAHIVNTDSSLLQVEGGPQVSMSEQDYKIVQVTPKDVEVVLEHLRKFFFREEPLNICVKLLGERGDEECNELENYCVQTIPEGTYHLGLKRCLTSKIAELAGDLLPSYTLRNEIKARELSVSIMYATLNTPKMKTKCIVIFRKRPVVICKRTLMSVSGY
jgi:hypothetical protein